MERLRKTLSFRRKKKTPESSKPHQWQEDERKVREGTCSFQVKYLGSLEVFESRGMQVCEDAVKVLYQNMKKATRFSFRKKPRGTRPIYATLYISGDSLRVVEDRSHMDAVSRITSGSDELNKGLIVDQTIEKVSFCAPDRNHDKAFAYICRDGTSRRWLCHAFLALKESGERLSHAVGCAFAVCLEKKQKREREAVQVTFSDDKTTFTRMGSFRQTTLTERMIDPQSAIVPDPVPNKNAVTSKPSVETAVRERPQATPDAFQRLGSFREFPKLSNVTSPFKRQLSLRLNELPSNVDRQQHDFQNAVAHGAHDNEVMYGGAVGPAGGATLAGALTDATTSRQQEEAEPFDPIAAMCQQLSQGLSSMTSGSTSHSQWNTSSTQPAAGPSAAVNWSASSTSAATSVGVARPASSQPPPKPAAATAAQHQVGLPQGGGGFWHPQTSASSSAYSSTSAAPRHRPAVGSTHVRGGAAEPDPFDAAWAMRTATSSATNPFLPGPPQHHHRHRPPHPDSAAPGVTKSFEMKM